MSVADRRAKYDAESVVPGGLSRRGWVILIGAVGAAAILLLVLSEVAITGHAGFVRADSASVSKPVLPQGAAVNPLPTPTPTPTPSAAASAPTQPVDALTTGDCLQTYTSPWAEGYPVVDCAAPHIAQVISTGTLAQPSGAPFPGAKTLDDQVTNLCSASNLLDWNWVAVWNEDVYVDVRYPNTNALWASGSRAYYCFVYTYSRHELTGSAIPAT